MCTLCDNHTAALTSPANEPQTHENYVAAIYLAALEVPTLTDEDRALIRAIRLVYGAGPDGTRGVTYYNRWIMPGAESPVPLVAICATGQESPVQVCGTTLHELGHVLAGPQAGHGPDWHAACARLGLGADGCAKVDAAGTAYTWDHFIPSLRATLQAIPLPQDGTPLGRGINAVTSRLKPCGAGIGTRGGASRGKGSGSRYLKWQCQGCPKPVSVRHAGTELDVRCNKCGTDFVVDPDSLPPAHTNGTGKLVPGTIAHPMPKAPAKAKAKAKRKAKRKPKAGPATTQAVASPAQCGGATEPPAKQGPELPPDYQSVPF
jgi:ribosomal protein S27E